ncbi:isopentenyl phosphate kinase family protein [Methanocalculus taiwanensis]|uniref:Isopentenyl phosphate kinase n=1 Tax=Methanocalculus taiwanensis TaxID=106207 RepID=A0ABD4TID8_9EURY|nr:isopentenyl phosphate kinase [Methanocalculus taiwanensis]MCQ1538491.1 isopentenyl phosphate kinase family protein [Methanocalculus taiwanensis]
MNNTVVLKLGGSVITEKENAGVIDHTRLMAIAETIASHNNSPLILIHGAGSCGHPEAERFGIQGGVGQTNAMGIGETHRAVAGLNATVVSILRDAGLDAIGIHPLSGSLAENGRLISFETGHLAGMARLGIIPVLHGDVVMDRTKGACIVSGDQLVLRIAEGVAPCRVGLATDVPGVLSDGRVVGMISRASLNGIDLGNSQKTDVTGGMKGKVEELLTLADAGIISSIFHIDRLLAFLTGGEHGGTTIMGADT